MALESGTYIKDLVSTNPPGTDAISQGDDHIRLIKSVLKNSFPSTNSAPIIPDISGNANKYLQVNSGATATQWSAIRQKGYVQKAKFEYSSSTAILIGAGEYELDDGSNPENFSWDSQLTFTLGPGGSNSSSSSIGTNEWQYIYMDQSNISASPLVAGSFLNSTTAPTYSQTKHGWYNGNDRCIFAVWIDNNGVIFQFWHDGNEAVGYSDSYRNDTGNIRLGRSNSVMYNTWSSPLRLEIPAFANKALVTFYGDGTALTGNITKYFFRTNGATTTSPGGHVIAKVEDDEAEWNVNGIQLFTDSSQQIQLYADANNTSQSIEVMTMGYFLPGGM